MPHPKRDDEPGAKHHVWHRGASRRTVAEHPKEARFFLSRFVREVRAGRVFVLAFAILTNHVHFFLVSRTGELASVLQSSLSPHTRRFNHPRDRSGALFSGRYKSRRVRFVRDGRGLTRYIHWNPVRGDPPKRPEEYRHSSAWYLGANRRVPLWLRRGWEAFPEFRPTLTSPPDDATWRLLEARATANAGREDPLDDLLGAAPEYVKAWFRRRALIADQHARLVPVADARAVLAVCDLAAQAEPVWRGNPGGRRVLDVWPLVRVGLLRELCGLGWRETGERLGIGGTTAKARHEGHGRCFGSDPAYADRFTALALQCLGTVDL